MARATTSIHASGLISAMAPPGQARSWTRLSSGVRIYWMAMSSISKIRSAFAGITGA